MWEDYSDFISNFRDDLEEPYILPDKTSFEKMLKTNTLGDYLGVPTQKTSTTVSRSSAIYRCTPSGGSSSQGFYFIASTQSWDSIFSQWTGVVSSINTVSCALNASDANSTVLFEIARYLHKQYKLPFKFTYPEEYLCLVRMTGKTPYYNPNKTIVNDTFIKYYLSQFCSQTVYEDLYYKAFSYALDCLSTALVS